MSASDFAVGIGVGTAMQSEDPWGAILGGIIILTVGVVVVKLIDWMR